MFFTGLATASSDINNELSTDVGNESIDVLFNQYYEEICLDELGKSGVYRLNVPNTITKIISC